MGGNVSMLQWLGKQYCKQSDKMEHSGPDGGAIPVSYEAASSALMQFISESKERTNKSEPVQ